MRALSAILEGTNRQPLGLASCLVCSAWKPLNRTGLLYSVYKIRTNARDRRMACQANLEIHYELDPREGFGRRNNRVIGTSCVK